LFTDKLIDGSEVGLRLPSSENGGDTETEGDKYEEKGCRTSVITPQRSPCLKFIINGKKKQKLPLSIGIQENDI
jgi:hypothetical protein